MVGLAVLELWAIRQDQIQHDRELKLANCKQLEQFQGIANGLKSSVATSYSQFQTTLGHVDSVLKTTQEVASVSKTNLAEVSGEGSHPCVVPDESAMPADKVPFVIWNRGKNILTGVEVSIHNMKQYREARAGGEDHRTLIGTLPKEWPKLIPAITPEIDREGVGHYVAEIWTQNGTYDEEINFRKAKNSQGWAFQYWLTKQEELNGPTKAFPKAHRGDSTGVPIKDCQRFKWSDGSSD